MRQTSAARDDIVDQYTRGECHVLAVALHRAFGWKILIILDDSEPYWIDDQDADNIIPGVVHAYAIDHNNRAWDIRGVRDENEISDEIGELFNIRYDRKCRAEIASNEEDLKYLCGYWNEDGPPIDRPLSDYTEDDVQEALLNATSALCNLPGFQHAT